MNLNYPTFAYGSYAQDQGARAKVVNFRIPIEIESVSVKPGDIVFGDIDGVCIVPTEVEQDVFIVALDKARGKKMVKHAIEAGMSAVEAYARYGIM